MRERASPDRVRGAREQAGGAGRAAGQRPAPPSPDARQRMTALNVWRAARTCGAPPRPRTLLRLFAVRSNILTQCRRERSRNGSVEARARRAEQEVPKSSGRRPSPDARLQMTALSVWRAARTCGARPPPLHPLPALRRVRQCVNTLIEMTKPEWIRGGKGLARQGACSCAPPAPRCSYHCINTVQKGAKPELIRRRKG